MSIWNKILIGLILVASLGFFYVATNTLKVHQAWKSAANSYVKPIEDAQARAKVLRQGDETPDGQRVPGIRDLKVRLEGLLVDRGRVWYGAEPKERTATANASVVVSMPNPPGIREQMILHVFEEQPVDQGGAYLGEFTVTGVAEVEAGTTIALAPTMKLSPRQLQQFAETTGTWVLYEQMPRDRHKLFAGMDEAQLAALMPQVPAEVRNEYLRHGQPATAEDPPERVVDGKYERQLRDYLVYFHEMHRRMSAESDRIAAATIDKAFAEQLRDDTQKQVAARQAEIDSKLKPELSEVQSEQDAIRAHDEALDARIAELRTEVDGLLAETRRLAQQWTAMQTQAAERIEEAIGQSTGGRSTGGQSIGKARLPVASAR